jgi:hypothetical protein
MCYFPATDALDLEQVKIIVLLDLYQHDETLLLDL